MELSLLRASILPASPRSRPIERVPPVAEHAIPFADNDLQGIIRFKQRKTFHSLSRRDVISFMSSSLFTTLLSTGTAEARPTRSENKRRAREKLENLREKAGLPKNKSKEDSSKKEKSLLESFSVPTVEATLLE